MKCVALGLFIGITIAILAGCNTTRAFKTVTEQVPEYGVEKIDVGDGVKCYSVTDKDNLAWSCVKVK